MNYDKNDKLEISSSTFSSDIVIRDSFGRPVCTMSIFSEKENAERIVKSANNHKALVDSLKNILLITEKFRASHGLNYEDEKSYHESVDLLSKLS